MKISAIVKVNVEVDISSEALAEFQSETCYSNADEMYRDIVVETWGDLVPPGFKDKVGTIRFEQIDCDDIESTEVKNERA